MSKLLTPLLLPTILVVISWGIPTGAKGQRVYWGGSFSVSADQSLIAARDSVLLSVLLASAEQDTYYVGLASWSPFEALGDSILIVPVDSNAQVLIRFPIRLRPDSSPIVQTDYFPRIGVAKQDPRTSKDPTKTQTLTYLESKDVRITVRDPDDLPPQKPFRWLKLAVTPVPFYALVFHPSGIWLASARDALYQSTTHGASWQEVASPPCPELPFSRVACLPSGVVLVVCKYGVARSTDTCKTWSRVPISNDNEHFNGFYVTSEGSVFLLGSTTFKSTDAGLNWLEANDGLEFIFSTIMLELDDGRLLLGGPGRLASSSKQHPVYNVKNPNSALFMSDRSGTHWKPTSVNHTTISSLARFGNTYVYACSREGGFWTSTNGGQDWTTVHQPSEFNLREHEVLIANAAGDVFANGAKGSTPILSISTDQGRTWRYSSDGMATRSRVLTLALDPEGYLVATTYGAGRDGVPELFKSDYPFAPVIR